MFPELEAHEIEYICDSIKEFFLINNQLKIKDIITENKPGILHCINNLIFETKRFFYIDSFNNILSENNKRGFHANLNFNELIIVIEGSIKLTLIDKELNKEITIVNKNNIYYIPKLKWIEYEILNNETIILCLVDKNLDDSISINNFEDFKKLN
jgi:hypothetical protein